MPVNKFGGMSIEFNRSDSEVSITYINNTFLRRDGTKSATGPLNMDTNRISNVVDPLDDQDAVTKRVHKRILLRMDGTKSASGTLNMKANNIRK